MPYVLVIGGLALLGLGGEAVVRGAVDLSNRLHVSKLLIGLFVVSLSTSSPELAVALKSVLGGQPDLAVGNVIGSNIANLLFVLAITAIICPVCCERGVKDRDLVVMLAVTGFFLIIAHRGMIGPLQGAFMVGLLLVYVAYSYIDELLTKKPAETLQHNLKTQDVVVAKSNAVGALVGLGWLGAGGVALAFGASFLVAGASGIARMWGVSEAVIGLTIVAIGTSLPELATVVVAALRRQPEVAVGGIIGSNIFNILAILGITAIVTPVAINSAFLELDVWVMLAATFIVLPFAASNMKLERWEGAVMLAGYGVYMFVLFRQMVF